MELKASAQNEISSISYFQISELFGVRGCMESLASSKGPRKRVDSNSAGSESSDHAVMLWLSLR